MWLKCYSDTVGAISSEGAYHRIINSNFIKEIYCEPLDIDGEHSVEVCVDAVEMNLARVDDGEKYEKLILAEFPTYEEAEDYLEVLREALNNENN